MDYGGLGLMHTTISTQFHSHDFIYLFYEIDSRADRVRERVRKEKNQKEMTVRKTVDGSQQTGYWHK